VWRRFGAGLSILNKTSKKNPSLPSKADILAFIGNRPGKVGTREIARAFGLKNAMRADLKRLLRELADEGSIERRRKKLHHAGTLPSTVLADVTSRDSDGDLIATQDEWDEDAHGAAPKIRRARPGLAKLPVSAIACCSASKRPRTKMESGTAAM
jgi:ribonuclease R